MLCNHFIGNGNLKWVSLLSHPPLHALHTDCVPHSIGDLGPKTHPFLGRVHRRTGGPLTCRGDRERACPGECTLRACAPPCPGPTPTAWSGEDGLWSRKTFPGCLCLIQLLLVAFLLLSLDAEVLVSFLSHEIPNNFGLHTEAIAMPGQSREGVFR